MLYIPKINDYLEILTDKEVKDFVAIILVNILNQLLYFFVTTSDEVQSSSTDNCIHHYVVEIFILLDPELQLINAKPVIKNKLKRLLNELRIFKVQTILVLDYKKRNDCKTFHSNTKLTASDSLMKHLNPCIKAL